METEWVIARMDLYRLLRTHPEWSTRQFAEALGYSLSWVKKWRKRLRETAHIAFETFLSQSRAPKTHPNRVHEVVRHAILALRDDLQEVYLRLPGPKRILYHLHRESTLAARYRLPTSTHTITRILHEGGASPSGFRLTTSRCYETRQWRSGNSTLGWSHLVLIGGWNSVPLLTVGHPFGSIPMLPLGSMLNGCWRH